jgi:hypothetical protein
MDLERLYGILFETTCLLRKGEEVVGCKLDCELPHLHVTELYPMPHESEAKPEVEKVDCHFVMVGVSKQKAEAERAPLLELLKTYPEPERLAAGISYIELGGNIGDQGAAFRLFALGKTLGLWDVVTPELFGFAGDEASRMAGAGFVMMTGWKDAS